MDKPVSHTQNTVFLSMLAQPPKSHDLRVCVTDITIKSTVHMESSCISAVLSGTHSQ